MKHLDEGKALREECRHFDMGSETLLHKSITKCLERNVTIPWQISRENFFGNIYQNNMLFNSIMTVLPID